MMVINACLDKEGGSPKLKCIKLSYFTFFCWNNKHICVVFFKSCLFDLLSLDNSDSVPKNYVLISINCLKTNIQNECMNILPEV